VGVYGSENTMIITNGGTVTVNLNAGSMTIGTTPNNLCGTCGSNNLVNVASGSLLVNNGSLNLGVHGGYGTLSIGGNGTVTVNGGVLYVSAFNSGNNTIVVSGGNLAVSNSTASAILDIGRSNPGSLTFNGGTITVNRLLVRNGTASVFTFNSGVLNLTAPSTNNFSQINMGVPFVVGDGVHAATVNLMNGGLLSVGTGLTISSNATLQGNGFVSAYLTVNSGGALSPGGSVGAITNNGDLVLNGGAILNYDLGLTSGDQIAVNGNLTLNGILNISDAGGFGVGTYTLIIYTGGLSGSGLTVGSKPNPSLTYTIDTTTAGQVKLVVSAPSDPFAQWQTHYFGSNTNPQAAGTLDPDGDGMSNTNEFLVGFAPNNSAAYLHIISIAKTGNDIKVTYLGANGDSTWSPGLASRTNVLEFTTGTANGSYLTNNFVSTGQTNILSGGTGVGVVTNMVESGGATNVPSRYYRVRVLVP